MIKPLTVLEITEISNITKPGMYHIGQASVEAIQRMLAYCARPNVALPHTPIYYQSDGRVLRLTDDENRVRLAILDILDGHRFRFYEGTVVNTTTGAPTNGVTEGQADSDRLDFCAAVIDRARTLKKLDDKGFATARGKDRPRIFEMLNTERECPGCIADHGGYHNQADRHDEQCKAENADPAAAHLAAAQAWDKARHHQHCKAMCCVSVWKSALRATAVADAATRAAPPNAMAFGATADAILEGNLELPAKAAAAHRRAAQAYQQENDHV